MRNTIFVATQSNVLVCHLTFFSYADNMNIVYKNLSGKVMKEMLNCVKHDSSLFILHSSFRESLAFTPRKVSFHRAKDHVSSH